MARKLTTMKEAQEILDSLAPGIYKVQEWNHPKKCVFLDTRSGQDFEYSFNELKRVLVKRPNFAPTTGSRTAKFQKKLEDVTSNYTLLEYNKLPSNSLFIDSRSGNKVEYRFDRLVERLRVNPEFIVDATDEQKKQVQDEARIRARKTNLKRYGCESPLGNKDIQKKIKETCLEKYGVENPMQNKEVEQKTTATILKRYGVRRVTELQEVKDRIVENTIEKHGVPYYQGLPHVKKKRAQSCVEKYGVEHPLQSSEVLELVKKTFEERYKGGHPLRDPQVREKSKQTCLEKYGVTHPMKDDVIKQSTLKKVYASKIKNGSITLINGKTLVEWASDKGVAHCTMHKVHGLLGTDGVLDYTKSITSIEQVVLGILEELVPGRVIHNKSIQDFDSNIRPDFQVKDSNVVVECDGLYWHSDLFKNKKSHRERRDLLVAAGYRPLVFRANEILNTPHIVKSIIKNALALNTVKVYARKCIIEEVKDTTFLQDNHLMGSGSGRCFALIHEGVVCSMMQVKWVNKNDQTLDVSRFCCAPDTTVVGGFTKLLKHVELEYSPNTIQTFIDLRYGSGQYLENLGFNRVSEHVSFHWTDFKDVFGRMKYPSNTGYEHGLQKIWDCGQAKWIKTFSLPTQSA